jgi:hypothetical protein
MKHNRRGEGTLSFFRNEEIGFDRDARLRLVCDSLAEERGRLFFVEDTAVERRSF